MSEESPESLSGQTLERWPKNFRNAVRILPELPFYPDVKKSELFEKEYIASKSSHSRGSTIDLTIISLNDKKELDKGSNFDFFGEQSAGKYKKITANQRANRLLLQSLMLKHGFKPYSAEWWHFTLIDEPFPETYFNFEIE